MALSPKISAAMQKEHQGEVAIAVDNKVVATGKNSVDALKKAKKLMPDIEDKEFLVFRIHSKYLAA